MKICDCHNDFLTELRSRKEKENYIKNTIIKNKNIRFVAAVIWTTEIKNVNSFIGKNYSLISLKKRYKKMLLSVEDMDFVVSDNNINFDKLNYLCNLKPFSCGLVWNDDNRLGGGAYGKSGLTYLGKVVVCFLEKKNILIDTAHMNRKTFYDFIKITNKPIYNSHSNIYSFKKHKRNLTDKQIKLIIDSNGFIGLSFVQGFIFDKIVDCNKVALQIKYFTDRFGFNNVGIGSDFFGTKDLPCDLKNYKDFKNLKTSLKKLNFTSKQIAKIFYKNFIDFKNRIEII